MKALLIRLGTVLSYIYTPRMAWSIGFVRSLIYTGWKRRSFRCMDGFLNYPVGTQGEEYISIGRRTVIGSGSLITAWVGYAGGTFRPEITIGGNCRIGQYNHITAVGRITIGNGVQTGRYVLVSDNSHGTGASDTPHERQLTTKGPVTIEDNVWIGDNAIILSGVHIGKGAVIGANSVVNKDIPEGCTAVGAPARVVKTKR